MYHILIFVTYCFFSKAPHGTESMASITWYLLEKVMADFGLAYSSFTGWNQSPLLASTWVLVLPSMLGLLERHSSLHNYNYRTFCIRKCPLSWNWQGFIFESFQVSYQYIYMHHVILNSPRLSSIMLSYAYYLIFICQR